MGRRGMLQRLSEQQIFRYGGVGIANTLVTAAAIYVSLSFGLSPVAANALGYAIGLANSYFLNGLLTFGRRGAVLPFIVAFFVAYGANLAVLLALTSIAALSPAIPQAAGLLTYNVVFFLAMKHYVFSHD